MPSLNDRHILRALAERWIELACQPVMDERKRLWTAAKDLDAQRPMILVETAFIGDYVSDSELQCEDPALRMVEKEMVWTIRHVEEVRDDITIEPCFRLGWNIELSDYGVPIECAYAQEPSLAFSVISPIHSVEDIEKLKPRTRRVCREKSIAWKETLGDLFGDILPVILHGNGGPHAGLTSDIFTFLGMEKMMLWMYDEPEAVHRIMALLRDDRISLSQWMEEEGLLALNNNSSLIGGGSPGYTTSLPAADYAGTVRLKDLWAWSESQETVAISPQQFADFFLPYMAGASKDYGLVYYGCCEPVHDRWTYLREAMPNIRAVSISHWCDMAMMGEMLGRDYVFSRKPMPAHISGETPDWDLLRKDVMDTLHAARGCNLEFIFRDIYTVNGDRSRLAKWVEMVRALM